MESNKPRRTPRKGKNNQSNKQQSLKKMMHAELKKLKSEGLRRTSRQSKALAFRAKKNPKTQNLSGVVGTRQNQGFGNRKRIMIKESEYIGEYVVANQPVYANTPYAVNPGQANTFPWLSTIAKNYEKYRFIELTFFYKPEVTEYSTGSNIGKVILSADYDASDAPPFNKQQQEDTDPHADGMAYQTIALTLDPKELHQNSVARFVRIGGIPANSDIKTYDCANFFIANQGQTTNGAILGELHVRYTVELSIPVLETLETAPYNHTVSQFLSYNKTLISGTTYINQYDGVSNPQFFVTNGLNIIQTVGNTQFTLPAGNYLFLGSCFFNGAGFVINQATFNLYKDTVMIGTGFSYYDQATDPVDNITGHNIQYIRTDGTSTFNTSSLVILTAGGSAYAQCYIQFILI